MAKPLVIDLCCGLGGWTRGFLAEGYEAVGFDIERHVYGDKRYPAQLVLQDIRTLHGSQFKDAAVIVASPPCQAYSHMAMPWNRAKREICWQEWLRTSRFSPGFHLTDLFDACFRIAGEAGVPLVVENVCGAQRWVGKARARYGSYFLWGNIASAGGAIVTERPVFGQTLRAARRSAQKFNPDGTGHPQGSWFKIADFKERGVKVPGINLRNVGFNVAAAQRYRQSTKGFVTGLGKGHDWRQDPSARFNSKSDSRKAASAMIAEIPFDLAQWIAHCFKPLPV